ncbi:(2Fe-2S)-binding protein [Streptomyces roseirectus]|uniref:(2Fe-2S)-binding protein n=1 Tax=Streptomyces roseirectus TaxID=2768066 RepID=A0A7H0II07_9ACTN|nr:(2Fe-2S)-binding protein [Streptomyces roseirectus]QNP72423.1 (2Fe-2S)-binding protein [Streptomyces roseirectus]
MTDEQHSQEHGTPQGVSRWDPLPQGDYDDGATAFVKLPEGGVDALLARDSPLAAPGHGYVPPPIAPTPGAENWGAPADGAEWPAPTVSGSGDDRFTYPGQQTGQWTYEEPPPAAPAHDVTGQWSIPVAGGDLPDESGEFTASALVEQQWGGDPSSTLPGGAAAPWAEAGWDQQGHAGHSDGRGVELPGLSGYSDGRGTEFGAAVGQSDVGQSDGHGVGYPEVHADGAPTGHAEGTGAGLEFGHSDGRGLDLTGSDGRGLDLAGGVEYGREEYRGEAGAHEGAAGAVAGLGEVAAPGEAVGPGEVVGHAPADSEAGAGAPALVEPDAASAVISRLTSGAGQRLAPEPEPEPEAVADTASDAGPDGHGVPAAEDAPGAASAEAAVEPAVEPAYEAPQEPVEAAESAFGAESDPEVAQGAPEGLEEAQEDAGADEAEEAVPPPGEEHPLASYTLSVNGADRPVTDAWIGESLLYVLRERLGLAGAKDGCSQGECGACNVQVDGRLVASCLVPAVTTAGSEVRTVEGLAEDGQPSDVQRALARCGAVQCGFCVPGMAMTVHDLLEGNPAPTELEARQALCGNLCRCSGYRGVLDAVQEVVQEREALAAAEAETDGDGARIPHQAGPGAGGASPSVFDTGTLGGQGQVFGQDGGQA